MYSDSDLEQAVAAGAMTAEAADALRAYVARGRTLPAVDEEHFRLLTGFNDIFVAIAAVILLVAVAWIGNAVGPRVDLDGPSPTGGLFVAAAAWGLAEFFTRKRRMALPSILLLLAFVGGVFSLSGLSLLLAFGPDHNDVGAHALIGAASAAIATGAAWLHWQRFRVPITIAAGAAAAAGVAIGMVAWATRALADPRDILLGFSLLFGIGIFLFAMWWDASDPRRETRRSDVAFWLHLLAAPMIVHPIFALLGITSGHATPAVGVIVLVVYALLGITALAIDRRALLVSALAYVLWALSDLFRSAGAIELNFALTALVIGSGLLLLSAFWHSARRAVVAPLPTGLRTKLPVLDRIGAAPLAA